MRWDSKDTVTPLKSVGIAHAQSGCVHMQSTSIQVLSSCLFFYLIRTPKGPRFQMFIFLSQTFEA